MYKFHFENEKLLVLSFFKNVLIWKYMLIAFIKNLRKIFKLAKELQGSGISHPMGWCV